MKILFTLASVCLMGGMLLIGCGNAAQQTNDAQTEEQPMVAEEAIEEDAPFEEANGKVQKISEKQYDKLVAHLQNPNAYIGYRPCIVDFYADWCGPCKRLAPIMEKLAAKYKGQITFFKVNVDENENLSRTYGIQSIPTVFFCANGEIRSQIGFIPEEDLELAISTILEAPLK